MKKALSVFLLASLLVVALIPAALATSAAPTTWDQLLQETLQSVENLAKNTRLTVSGESYVTATPDTAVVNVGITATEADVKTAQDKANQITQDMLDALLALEIPQASIATSNYSVYPTYDYSGDTRVLNGYQVSSQLSVTLTDFDLINQVIDTAVEKGANEINGLSFDVSNRSQYYQQALAAAIENGQAKAAVMAQAAGKTLGDLVEVIEQGSGVSAYAEVKMMDAPADAGAGTNIQAGETQVSANVTLVYELQ